MKKFSIITIIIGALMLIVGVAPLLLSFLMVPSAPSVSIIGGADSPTLKFAYFLWTGSFYHHLAFWGVIALIVGVVLLIINKFKKK